MGFCTFSMTDAMVNVFPLRVTPSSTWSHFPSRTPLAKRFNGRGLVAAGRIGGFEHKTVHGKGPFVNCPLIIACFPGAVQSARQVRTASKNFHHPPFLFAALRPYASKTRFPAGWKRPEKGG